LDPSKRFSDQKYINLETYAKDGKPIRTPVFVVEDGGVVYVRTDPRTGKIKRIRNNPHVRIAPSDGRGAPKGDWTDGEAQLVEGQDAARILGLFKKKYGYFGRIAGSFNRIRGINVTAVISIRV
jgi:uncharacterized protein